jgi:hypothetical protein
MAHRSPVLSFWLAWRNWLTFKYLKLSTCKLVGNRLYQKVNSQCLKSTGKRISVVCNLYTYQLLKTIMCHYCEDLGNSQSIHNQSELNRIVIQLKEKALNGFLKVVCLFTGDEIPYFQDYDCSKHNSGIVNLRFCCTHCNDEYSLFADNLTDCLGFFGPNRA